MHDKQRLQANRRRGRRVLRGTCANVLLRGIHDSQRPKIRKYNTVVQGWVFDVDTRSRRCAIYMNTRMLSNTWVCRGKKSLESARRRQGFSEYEQVAGASPIQWLSSILTPYDIMVVVAFQASWRGFQLSCVTLGMDGGNIIIL